MRTLLAISILLIIGVGCKSKSTHKDTGITFKDVNVSEANKMIQDNQDLVILDVRTPEETDKGVIPNAIIIDFYNDNFDSEIAKLDKSKSYLVYCRSGGRSVGASNKMIEAGFSNVTNMKGGYSAWSK